MTFLNAHLNQGKCLLSTFGFNGVDFIDTSGKKSIVIHCFQKSFKDTNHIKYPLLGVDFIIHSRILLNITDSLKNSTSRLALAQKVTSIDLQIQI